MSVNEENLELIRLIWADKFVDSTEENREIQNKLRLINNSLQVFDNCQECEDFIKNNLNSKSDQIILILSGQFGQNIIENIHQLKQIISIFIFCGDKQKNESWAKNYKKVFEFIHLNLI